MSHDTSTIAPDVEYHRVLERRGVGRGILAIVLLLGGMLVFGIVLTAAAAAVEAATGTEARDGWSSPLIQAAGFAAVALLIPWSMFLQRRLYGVPGASLHSVVSRFRFDLFGRALLFTLPAWVAVMAFHYWSPLPQSAPSYTEVLWMLLATVLLTPLQAAGEALADSIRAEPVVVPVCPLFARHLKEHGDEFVADGGRFRTPRPADLELVRREVADRESRRESPYSSPPKSPPSRNRL